MPKTLRIVLIWMLMLALPAQGMAAMAMQLDDLASRSSGAAEAHHPGALATDQQLHASPHLGHHADGGGEQQANASVCGLCAFCVGAVALTSVLGCHAPLLGGEPSLARLDLFVGFVADTPRRPPRPFLA